MRKLTLIGMPGSGKSAVGKILADRLGWKLADTDKYIEQRHGVALQALIDRVGEEEFLRIEEQALLELPLTEPTIVSTGGSAVYSDAGMRRLGGISIVVFLDAPFEAVRAHIGAEAPRGIIGLARAGGLAELFQERVPLYRHYANAIVSFGPETPEEAALKILSELPKDWQIE